jgi:hypothetical protein
MDKKGAEQKWWKRGCESLVSCKGKCDPLSEIVKMDVGIEKAT